MARLSNVTVRQQLFLSLLAHHSIPDRHYHIVDFLLFRGLYPNLPECLDQYGIARNSDDRFALGGNEVVEVYEITD